jgi:hypothetical protein
MCQEATYAPQQTTPLFDHGTLLQKQGTSTPIILAVFRGAYTTVSESWHAADRARSYPQGSLISNAARL